MAKNNKKTKKRDPSDLQSFSATYWALRPFWNDCLQLKEPIPYALGIPGIGLYLNKFSKEEDDEFASRLQRLAQVNFVDLIVESFSSMLFSTSIQIDSEKYKDEVNKFINCCNSQGDTLQEYFAEMIGPSASTYGVTD